MWSLFPQDDRLLNEVLTMDNALQDGSQSAVTSSSHFIFLPFFLGFISAPLEFPIGQ